jgi:hypothetical protein
VTRKLVLNIAPILFEDAEIAFEVHPYTVNQILDAAKLRAIRVQAGMVRELSPGESESASAIRRDRPESAPPTARRCFASS